MAGDSELLFQQGLAAYGRGDAAAAEGAFRTLVEQGHDGPDVLYNLGTTALAQGKVGEAVFALEQARREGGGADVEANLTIARARQLDQLVGSQAEEPFVERVAAATSPALAGGLFAGLWALGFLLLAAPCRAAALARMAARRCGLGARAAASRQRRCSGRTCTARRRCRRVSCLPGPSRCTRCPRRGARCHSSSTRG